MSNVSIYRILHLARKVVDSYIILVYWLVYVNRDAYQAITVWLQWKFKQYIQGVCVSLMGIVLDR